MERALYASVTANIVFTLLILLAVSIEAYNPFPNPCSKPQFRNDIPCNNSNSGQGGGSSSNPGYPGMSENFYSQTCPNAERIVFEVMRQAVQNETRVGASILRLHFHDCFVNGCDGSLLLDDTPTFAGEKTAVPNNNSARGFNVIDNIKSQIENACPGVVSCADILAIAARDGVVLSGGPSWNVVLGRRDSRTANLSGANNNIPPPTSNLSTLISTFQAQGLSVEEMVTLSGAHTIGFARCTNFKQSLYNQSGDERPDSTIDPSFLKELQSRCPPSGGDDLLSPLDYVTSSRFDNYYYSNLRERKGLLHSDRVLYDPSSGGSTINTVDRYSSNQIDFTESFKRAIVKLGNISPPAGQASEIRRDCRKVN